MKPYRRTKESAEPNRTMTAQAQSHVGEGRNVPDASEIRARARREKAVDLLAEGHGEHAQDEETATSLDYLLARLIVAVEALEERLAG
jgi:hypothetical protein